ncbi:hypothetical protein BOX15_Mlig027656g1 [Macrostomum lignano]|uniref:Uncharacterized protein n=1 Tax=Macrostomum lignano TaxID=282301 RepID=A0A267EL58_9PLAT|nr:hypothetical protein BOX15_Mlig027656g3 [Macrostomum lignano]PAA53057.1 hypothetical protein BOX15_Mlig027656g2 [Macrostomum lignano]PAA62270.1 hypothetical protein BOX15_Mlig027656g1 [Macrostomum lignano]
MQSMQTVHLLCLLALATIAGARRCQVSQPPATADGAWTHEYKTCDSGSDFCFRGRLTGTGERAIRELFDWPVTRGQVLRACVESIEPPMEDMWSWYELKSIRVCATDGCNSS